LIVTFDSNVFVYCFDHRYPAKQAVCSDIVDGLSTRRMPLGLQVIGESFRVLTRKLAIPGAEIAAVLRSLMQSQPTFAATEVSTLRALSLAAPGRLSFWDANLLSAAEAAGCTHILSEDMGDGFRLGRLEVVNPFSGEGLSPRARALLDL
jgi:predicted nucleic acid-binding protein